MTIARTLKTAMRALRRNVMRAVLTTLGIVIGVGAVISIVAATDGLQKFVLKEFATVGASKVWIFPNRPREARDKYGWRQIRVTPQEAEGLLDKCPSLVRLTPVIEMSTSVQFGEVTKSSVAIQAVRPTWHEIEAQSRSQQEHRRNQPRPAPWMDPAALTRWSVLLRVVGQLLDAQGVSDCVIDAAVASEDAPEGCRVQVTADDRVVLDSEAVRLQLLRLRTKYIEARDCAPEPAPERPWWAFWRRE